LATPAGYHPSANACRLLHYPGGRPYYRGRRTSELNSRLSTLFALNLAVLALLSASLRFGSQPLPAVAEYLAYATLFTLLMNVVVLLWTYRVDQRLTRPDLSELGQIADQQDSLRATSWSVGEIRVALEEVDRYLKRKALWVTWSMISTGVSVALVAAVSGLSIALG
ncbi:MAG: hypothetical protein OXN87_13040, partial [Chloroflexota bacterium]|nr:hypothetical protein [Chloroflexota bacterium]